MAKGQSIIVSAEPRGVFLEGQIIDTSKPGTIMEFTSAAEIGQRKSWQASTQPTGMPRLMACLREDMLQGFTFTSAYVANTRCFMYCPIAGEEMNMILEGSIVGPGTGSVQENPGQRLMATTTGKLVNAELAAGTTTPVGLNVPFLLEETIDYLNTNMEVDQLIWCMFTGY